MIPFFLATVVAVLKMYVHPRQLSFFLFLVTVAMCLEPVAHKVHTTVGRSVERRPCHRCAQNFQLKTRKQKSVGNCDTIKRIQHSDLHLYIPGPAFPSTSPDKNAPQNTQKTDAHNPPSQRDPTCVQSQSFNETVFSGCKCALSIHGRPSNLFDHDSPASLPCREVATIPTWPRKETGRPTVDNKCLEVLQR